MHSMHLVGSQRKLFMIRIISLSLARIVEISSTQNNLKHIGGKKPFKYMPVVEMIRRAKGKLKMLLVLLRIALRSIVFIQHSMTGMNKEGNGSREEVMVKSIIQQRKNRSMFFK